MGTFHAFDSYWLVMALKVYPVGSSYRIVARYFKKQYIKPDSKVHGANKGRTWVLSAPDGPHVGPMNFAIREHTSENTRK